MMNEHDCCTYVLFTQGSTAVFAPLKARMQSQDVYARTSLFIHSGAPRTIGPSHHQHRAGTMLPCPVHRFRLCAQVEWPASRSSR